GGLRIEMALRERVGELGLGATLQMIEIGIVSEQVENEDFHDAASWTAKRSPGSPRNARNAVATAAITAKPIALKNTCRGSSPRANKKPPSGAAAMPPKRPMPSAQPMPLVRIRAG